MNTRSRMASSEPRARITSHAGADRGSMTAGRHPRGAGARANYPITDAEIFTKYSDPIM
ncbi:hypothetical protein Mesop_4330 [Mesorhizobium opportunistum WSM2075]|uniref:Uncharacterized protein n=1 Tax=Mesorhizobium opportunistum (strain LMG 24607 / HAMBI 3007 / WSM2075) TaxID=536019 RepID=F7Y9N4_MESOW|nr:hypothetical protein Mesop_4330 [Mesorhizobium opportunistum WSM2075]